MRIRKPAFAAVLLALATLLCACSQEPDDLKSGYYSAEAAAFDEYGWKEYVTIYVSNGRIITVEYNAFNSSGFVKSWDIDYMRTMNNECGTYPNEFARAYAISLINWQNYTNVDAISGATDSYKKFQLLAQAVIAKSKAGDKRVALVDFPS